MNADTPLAYQLAREMAPADMAALPGKLLRREIKPADYLHTLGVVSFHDWLIARCPTIGAVAANWDWPYLAYIQEHLDLMTVGLVDRLMVMLPPRHCKSELCTIRYPVYRMELEAATRIMVGSYNADSAADFSRAARLLARMQKGANRGPNAGQDKQDKVYRWNLRSNGSSYLGGGVESGFIGKGGDVVILDDPIKNRKEADSLTYRNRVWNWWSDIYTRLEPGAQVIIVMHSWHQDDVAERILRQDKHREWTVIRLAALAREGDLLGRAPGEALCPDRFPAEELERTRDNVQEITWESNYQQSPMSPKGAIFLREWWAGRNRYDWADIAFRSNTVDRIISLDTAMSDADTANYTAACVMDLQSDYRCGLRYMERRKLAFPQLMDFAVEMIQRWRGEGGAQLSHVLVEYKASGMSLVQSLIGNLPADMRSLVKAMPKSESKQTCYRAITPYCRNGCVLLPYPSGDVPWLHDFEEELYAQPSAEYDDQADAFTQGVDWYEHMLQGGMDKRRA